MANKDYDLNDIVEMKKPHPCKTNAWRIIRMGADIRMKCQGCGQSVMMPRHKFEKKMKKVIKKGDPTENPHAHQGAVHSGRRG